MGENTPIQAFSPISSEAHLSVRGFGEPSRLSYVSAAETTPRTMACGSSEAVDVLLHGAAFVPVALLGLQWSVLGHLC